MHTSIEEAPYTCQGNCQYSDFSDAYLAFLEGGPNFQCFGTDRGKVSVTGQTVFLIR